MAYVDRQPFSHRLANLGTAGLIEAGIAVALIAGLSTTFAPKEEAPQITATNYPSDPPPAIPQTQPEKAPEQSTITVLDPPISFERFPDPGPTASLDPFPPTEVTGTGEIPGQMPTAKASPLYAAVGASPHNDPGEWVTPADYPSRDLREGNQGTTRFRVIVGSNGRVQSCEVTASSGFASLDRVTCDKVARRARFDPATDGSGTRVVGSYTSAVVWRIPR